MRIGVLGGTFDPIHEGHLAVAHTALQQFRLDKMILVPDFKPPHKEFQGGASPEDRLAMTQLASQNFPHFEVSDIEIKRAEISYTIDTLKTLKKQYPGSEFFLIMGADNYAHFEKWKEPDEIRKMAQILVAPREGVEVNLDRTSPIVMPHKTLSSTEIRKGLQKGQFGSSMIPQGVLDYIRKQHLYGL